MKINFDTILMTLDGKSIKESPNEDSDDLTLATASVVALFNTGPDVKGPEKLNRFVLAQRIKQNPIVDLSAEDITIIRKEIGVTYGPLVYGRASEILDLETVKKLHRASETSKE